MQRWQDEQGINGDENGEVWDERMWGNQEAEVRAAVKVTVKDERNIGWKRKRNNIQSEYGMRKIVKRFKNSINGKSN